MTSGDWLTVTLWALGSLGAVAAGLLSLLAYFLKRMVDQFDSTRKAVHDLRNELHTLSTRFKIFKVEMRLLLKTLNVDTSQFEAAAAELGDDDELPIPLE
jgi:hypothetical protein